MENPKLGYCPKGDGSIFLWLAWLSALGFIGVYVLLLVQGTKKGKLRFEELATADNLFRSSGCCGASDDTLFYARVFVLLWSTLICGWQFAVLTLTAFGANTIWTHWLQQFYLMAVVYYSWQYRTKPERPVPSQRVR